MFLEEGMIVYTKGRLPEHDQEFKADSLSYCRDVPMVVLVDRGSASASEIVTGALKDHKRATIVGQKTFGKGVVQTVKPIGEGLALSFTTAKYYTPSGVCIHKLGIEPDVAVALPELTEDEIQNAKKLWESGRIPEFVKRHTEPTDAQLETFRQEIAKTNIILPANIVRRMVRAEAYRNDEVLYDIQDDPQLAKAVEILLKKKK
jgi:carboxyl-terminal processing protease